MATLYEINKDLADCIDAETGEIVDVDKYESLGMAREEKIENILLWIKNLRSDAEAYKAEAKSFSDKQKAAENKADNLQGWMESVLGGEKFKTSRVQVTYHKSESVKIDADAKIPEAFIRIKSEPNKAELKRFLKQGGTVEGVSLEKKRSMSIK